MPVFHWSAFTFQFLVFWSVYGPWMLAALLIVFAAWVIGRRAEARREHADLQRRLAAIARSYPERLERHRQADQVFHGWR